MWQISVKQNSVICPLRITWLIPNYFDIVIIIIFYLLLFLLMLFGNKIFIKFKNFQKR